MRGENVSSVLILLKQAPVAAQPVAALSLRALLHAAGDQARPSCSMSVCTSDLDALLWLVGWCCLSAGW